MVPRIAERFGLIGPPSVYARACVGRCLADRRSFPEAARLARKRWNSPRLRITRTAWCRLVGPRLRPCPPGTPGEAATALERAVGSLPHLGHRHLVPADRASSPWRMRMRGPSAERARDPRRIVAERIGVRRRTAALASAPGVSSWPAGGDAATTLGRALGTSRTRNVRGNEARRCTCLARSPRGGSRPTSRHGRGHFYERR